jgi:hypothetical protein
MRLAFFRWNFTTEVALNIPKKKDCETGGDDKSSAWTIDKHTCSFWFCIRSTYNYPRDARPSRCCGRRRIFVNYSKQLKD